MSIYDAAFYERIGAESARSAAAVLRVAFSGRPPGSLVDVGGGGGVWAREAVALGVPDADVVDGAHVPKAARLAAPERFHARDLSRPFTLTRQYEWALCMEVAEHLPPRRAEGFAADVAQAADAVLFSAALPFQGGDGHVNEMWPEYWAALFAAHGLLPYDLVRPALWRDRAVAWWYRQNTLLFAREDYMAAARPDVAPADAGALTRIHPEAYLALARRAPPPRWRYGARRDADIYYDPSSADVASTIGYGAEFDSVPRPTTIEPLFRGLRAVIVGPGRVGSTMLADLLSLHPDAFCLNESHDLPLLTAEAGGAETDVGRLLAAFDRARFHDGRSPAEANAQRAGRRPEHFRAYLARVAERFGRLDAAALQRLVGAYFLWASGKRVLVDKTPDYACHLDAVSALWPDAKVVLMVRDASATVASMLRHEGYRALALSGATSWSAVLAEGLDGKAADGAADGGGDPDDPAAHLAIWAARVEAALAFGETADATRFTTLRFEDLCARPTDELRRVARFLGIDPTADWLEGAAAVVAPPRPAAPPPSLALDGVEALRRRLGYV